MISDKYWINPDGDIVEVTDRHILAIYQEPEKFGLSKAWVMGVFRKNRERPGADNKSRETILEKLMDQGWIRLRNISRRDDTWTVQVSEKSDLPYSRRLTDWARMLLSEGGKNAGYSAVVIINLKPEVERGDFRTDPLSVNSIAEGALLERRKKGILADYLNPGRAGLQARRPKKYPYGIVVRRKS